MPQFIQLIYIVTIIIAYEFLENGVKSCMNCAFPHHRKNYDLVNERFGEIADLIKRNGEEDGSHEV